MKNINLIRIFFFISVAVISCKKENQGPLNIDFELLLTGESPNASLSVTNKTDNGTSFLWMINKGVGFNSLYEENPEPISIDKSGLLEVTLYAGNDSEIDSLTKLITVTGYNGINTFTNVQFSHNTIPGRFFSAETGRIYPDHKIDDQNGPLIDIVFNHIENTVLFFDSPDNNYNIPEAIPCEVINYDNSQLSIEEFDAMIDDRTLSTLEIYIDNNSFSTSDIPHVILFETYDGIKGAIKTISDDGNTLTVDIKTEKF